MSLTADKDSDDSLKDISFSFSNNLIFTINNFTKSLSVERPNSRWFIEITSSITTDVEVVFSSGLVNFANIAPAIEFTICIDSKG